MNELHTYICPKCGEPLHRDGGSFRCTANHVYDCARSGYVNLLLVQQMNTKLPGDNKLMVNARKNFLGKGYYDVLINAFSDCVKKYSVRNGTVLDAGCGEGIYTVSAAKKYLRCSLWELTYPKPQRTLPQREQKPRAFQTCFSRSAAYFICP